MKKGFEFLTVNSIELPIEIDVIDRTSMLYWWPRILDLEIPQPRTELVIPTEEELERMKYESLPHSFVEKVQRVINFKFQLPVFLRTDLASGKHDWENCCYYDGTKELWRHLLAIIEFNLCADFLGLDFHAFAVREYIPMNSIFKAFWGNMPVNPERRYFINNGRVICHHPYWIEEAIARSDHGKLPSDWRMWLEQINIEIKPEIKLLTSYSMKIAERMDGYWSIDFCKAKSGKWILIDMAEGKKSWHPEDCPFSVTG